MSNNLTKAELIRQIAEETGLPQAACGNVLESLGRIITASTIGGVTVLAGFGRFTPKLRAARTGRNPRTGEPIEIPERMTVSFKPAATKS